MDASGEEKKKRIKGYGKEVAVPINKIDPSPESLNLRSGQGGGGTSARKMRERLKGQRVVARLQQRGRILSFHEELIIIMIRGTEKSLLQRRARKGRDQERWSGGGQLNTNEASGRLLGTKKNKKISPRSDQTPHPRMNGQAS